MHGISFTVYGDPATAGSKKAFVIKGRPVIVDTSGAKGRDWRRNVQAAALEAAEQVSWEATRQPLELTVRFYLPRPKVHYNAKGAVKSSAPSLHTTKPDLTKLLRAVEDALTGILWHDDSQIVKQTVAKHYTTAGPKTEVIVLALQD